MKFPKINIRSYRQRLILLTAVSFLLTAVLTGLYAAFTFRKITLQKNTEILETLTEEYAAKISNIIARNHRFTQAFANLIAAENIAANTLGNYLHPAPSLTALEINIYNNSDKEKQNRQICLIKRENQFQKTDNFQTSINEKFTIPPELASRKQSIFQSPEYIKAAGKNQFVYAVTSPVLKNGNYIGYVRMLFSTNRMADIINKPIDFRGKLNFAIVSEDESFVAVTGKERLAGKGVRISQTTETQLFDFHLNNRQAEKPKNKLSAAAKIYNPYSIKNWTIITYVSDKEVLDDSVNEIYITILIAFILLSLALIIIIISIRAFFKPLDRTIKQAENTVSGDNTTFNENSPYPEFNRLAKTFNRLIERRRDIQKTAQAIENDNYFLDLEPMSNKDTTAQAINSINQKLRQIEAENEKQQAENEIRNWQRKGQLKIAEVQRTGSNETEALSTNIIRTLVKYTVALLGAIYVKRYENSGKAFLELTGAYAFEERRNIKVIFAPGESIIGTCAQEQKKIYLENLPENYITIGSGMGSGKPGFLCVFPIFSQKKLVAVSEIAFMKKPEDHKLHFIEQLGENIGAWLSAAENQKRTRKLLKLSQEKTRELSEKEAELDSMLKAINRTVLTVQYAPDGQFISANKLYYDTTGYTHEELKDTNVQELVKDKKDELKKIINKVKQGISTEQRVVRYTKSGRPIPMKATYSPYYNSEGKITRVIFFGIIEEENK